jgi:hypothetical protein
MLASLAVTQQVGSRSRRQSADHADTAVLNKFHEKTVISVVLILQLRSISGDTE